MLHALIPAAGLGDRFGGGTGKQFQEISGRPVLIWALERLREAGIERFVVALPISELSRWNDLVADGDRVRCVAGGASRQASVRLCLDACSASADELVLVHDAARPAVDPGDVRSAVAAAQRAGGAVLGRPVTDTLKRVTGDRIVETASRAGLFRAETPQVFRRRVLDLAFARAAAEEFEGSDESSLVERLSDARIEAVVARRPNPKVTWRGDLVLLEALLGAGRGRVEGDR